MHYAVTNCDRIKLKRVCVVTWKFGLVKWIIHPANLLYGQSYNCNRGALDIQLISLRVGNDVHLLIVFLPGSFFVTQFYDFTGAQIPE